MKFFEVEYMANGRRQKMTLKANNRSEAQAIAKTKNAGVVVKVGGNQERPIRRTICRSNKQSIYFFRWLKNQNK